VSKLQIGNGLVRISAGNGRNLAKFVLRENDDESLDDESLTELRSGRVRIVGGGQSAEPGARS